MRTIFGLLIASILLSGSLVPGFAESDSVECKEAFEAKKQIEVLDRKYSELKKNAYLQWESLSKSGQYSGTWEEFSQKFLDSVEVKEIQTLRQKYAEIDQKCPQHGAIKPEYSDPSKKECNDTDYQNIKKSFFIIEQKMIAAKERYYKEWESLTKSGKYLDSWEQFAKDNLHTSPEALEYQKAQTKYGSLIQYCQSEQVVTKTLQIPAGCDQSELNIAKKTMLESDAKVTALKEKLYSEWKTQTSVGKTTDAWDAYMKQHFDNAAEVKEWRQVQEKYTGIIHICTPTNADVAKPNSPMSLQTAEKSAKKSVMEKKKESDKSDKLKKSKKIKKSKRSESIKS